MNTPVPLVPSLASTPVPSVFPFLKLPRELRDMIYELSLASSNGSTLRDKEELRISQGGQSSQFDPDLFNNAIMRVCKAVFAEAHPVFYARNIFHYALKIKTVLNNEHKPNITSLSQRFLQQTPSQHMRHISFGVQSDYPRRLSCIEIEQMLPRYLDVVATSCPQLYKLDLHLISSPFLFISTARARRSWQAAGDIAKMEWEGATLEALRRIITQTRLSHLTVTALPRDESEDVFTELCLPLAPIRHWNISNHYAWEGFTLRLSSFHRELLMESEAKGEHAIQRWTWLRKQQ